MKLYKIMINVYSVTDSLNIMNQLTKRLLKRILMTIRFNLRMYKIEMKTNGSIMRKGFLRLRFKIQLNKGKRAKLII